MLGSVCASDTDVAGLESLELLLRAQFVGHDVRSSVGCLEMCDWVGVGLGRQKLGESRPRRCCGTWA